MKSDIRTINLNNLDVNALELPNEEFTCYVQCNNTSANNELLLKMIKGEVKEINISGKYASYWDFAADKICVEYENNNTKPADWSVLTACYNLDFFIRSLAFSHVEYYDDEVLSHDLILLFYDDENLKNFIIKRVEWYLENSSTPDLHENDEDYDYDIDFKKRERIELNVHTNKTKHFGLNDADMMVYQACNQLHHGGMAITDSFSTKGLIPAYRISKNKKNFKVLYGVNVEIDWIDNVNIICRNKNGFRAINEYLTHYFAKENKKISYEDAIGLTYYSTERQKILDDNRNDLLIGLPYYSNTTANALKGKEWINEIHEDIADCDYIEVAPLSTYKLFYPNESDDRLKNAIKLLINVAKKENVLVVAVGSPYYAFETQKSEFSIIWLNEKSSIIPEDYNGHYLSTEEMRYAFDWLNDDTLIEEIVVTNTHRVADMCDNIKLFNN